MAIGSAGTLAKLGSVLAVAAVSVTATVVIAGPPSKVFAVGPHAWFDEPLDGTYLAEGPVHVMAHAADPDGVVEVVLSVGGEVAQTVDAGGDQLVDVKLDWTAPGNGTFELTVVGVDNHQHKTVPDTVTVHIGEDPSELALEDATTTTVAGEDTTTSSVEDGSIAVVPGPTTTQGQTTTTAGASTTIPTTTPTTTTTTPTTTPTTVPCPGTPVNASPANGSNANSNTTLTWGYSGCPVAEFQVQVSRDSGFARLHQQTFVPWPERSTVAAVGCGTDPSGIYYWRVRTEGPVGPWSSTTSFTLVCRASP